MPQYAYPRLALALLCLAAPLDAGCSCGATGGRPGRGDTGIVAPEAGTDAGVRIDAGGMDAGIGFDGGGEIDSGVPDLDAGGADGGADPDGGGPDGGRPMFGDVRFVVMGDQGEGNADQRSVAIQVRDLCAAEGCDFVLLLGDNFYDSGVDSVTDPLWNTHFETPYTDIMLPFYAVLGNHDYGGTFFGLDYGGLGNEWHKGPIEVAYTALSSRWEMPDTHYTVMYENVGFVMLDTNSIMWANTEHGDQAAWFPTAVADLRADGAEWIVVSGHHPYLSNGRHGNAGSYEGIEVGGIAIPNPVPLLNGSNVRAFFDGVVCGEADIIFSGHDHNRQWIDEPGACGGAELIVSGAGAKTTEPGVGGNSVHFEDYEDPGFMYVVIDGDQMTGRFVDIMGATSFEMTVTRRP